MARKSMLKLVKVESLEKITQIGLELAMTKDSTDFAELIM